MSFQARGRSQLYPSVLWTRRPLQSGVLSVQGPSRIRLCPLEWPLTSYRYPRACLYFLPTYANPSPRGVGIQVSGWSRDWVSTRPFSSPPQHRYHIIESTVHQWPRCSGAIGLWSRSGSCPLHKFAYLNVLMGPKKKEFTVHAVRGHAGATDSDCFKTATVNW